MRVNRTDVRPLPRATNTVAGGNKQALDPRSQRNSHLNTHSSCPHIWVRAHHMLLRATITLTYRGLRQQWVGAWRPLGTLLCRLSTHGGRAYACVSRDLVSVAVSRSGNGLVTVSWWEVLGCTWGGSVFLVSVVGHRGTVKGPRVGPLAQ
jgi:hypothetical protein